MSYIYQMHHNIVTRKQFVSLAADKVLLPATHIPTIKSPWRLEDGRNLVRELNEKVHQTATGHGPWESIQNAKVRTKLSVGFIISAIRDGHLQISKFEGLDGYRSFCVSKAEMDKLAAKIIQEAGPDVQSSDRAVCTAAAFGRSVGMRENEAFLRLVRGGHTPASQITTSKAGQQRFYLTQDDIAAFHERFVTQNTLATKYSTFWRTIISQLKSEGIAPFTFKGEEYGHLYLRAHAEEFLQTKYAQTKLSDHKVHNH
ncbi:hypothetical protein [Halocynthiibacter styelae]|uniref:Uncharacterized protein n=1 Tax=Halocynthiibacter styelae TaxID=2761955 RepID=A0A8J7J6I1_9RHOB|nr:hypothetical protein [Paenihalocynthiibacter styelae]MBI1494505.1 hypothetical protein [Paenihalocynthiibacter styelae]